MTPDPAPCPGSKPHGDVTVSPVKFVTMATLIIGSALFGAGTILELALVAHSKLGVSIFLAFGLATMQSLVVFGLGKGFEHIIKALRHGHNDSAHAMRQIRPDVKSQSRPRSRAKR